MAGREDAVIIRGDYQEDVMCWLQSIVKYVMENWPAIIVMFAVGILLFGIGWLPQKIGRNNDRKKADERLQQQRKDLRADFREDLKSIIPVLLEAWSRGRHPKQEITPKIKAEFAGMAETISTGWYEGKDIEGILIGQE